jgi:hypothetical protein
MKEKEEEEQEQEEDQARADWPKNRSRLLTGKQ